MAHYKSAVITDDGQNLLLNSISGKSDIEFTRLSFGSGKHASDEELNLLKSLKSEKQSVAISSIKEKSANSVVLSAVLQNKDLKQGYRITEIGLFAKDRRKEAAEEILYAVAVAEDSYADYFPPYNGYAPITILQDFYIEVADSSNTTILFDNTALVSMNYLKENYLPKDESMRIETIHCGYSEGTMQNSLIQVIFNSPLICFCFILFL